MTEARSILAVDDQAGPLELHRQILSRAGYQVTTASNGIEALRELERHSFDLVVSDLWMPEMDGLDLLLHIQQRWRGLPVVIVTAMTDVQEIVQAVQLGAINYLVKPVPAAALLDTTRKALAAGPGRTREAPQAITELVGDSPSMMEVRHLVTLAAGCDVPVLISGETGTGKELAARAIHRYSALADKPFVPHNCAVMPHDLFESQFFGHRRGAFTGADRDFEGLLVQANGGVLLLDELQSLLVEHQAKLLRILDDGEVRPVGSTTLTRVNVRYLASTNNNPAQMVEEGRLRHDLYYRLRGFEIVLPPLSERRSDIPVLARHFVPNPDQTFAPEAMEALAKAPWPGNVRELRHTILAAAAAAGAGRIELSHLGLDSRARLHGAHEGSTAQEAGPPMTLREAERQAIQRALESSAWNRSEAARVLGINRSTLRRKMNEYEIHESGEGSTASESVQRIPSG